LSAENHAHNTYDNSRAPPRHPITIAVWCSALSRGFPSHGSLLPAADPLHPEHSTCHHTGPSLGNKQPSLFRASPIKGALPHPVY
jgi:hypothetical protein